MQKEVDAVILRIRPMLQADDGDVELVDVREGIVWVKFAGPCDDDPLTRETVRNWLERILMEEVPEVRRVVAI